MANFNKLPSQVTSSYWDPENFANWGIPRKSSKPQPVAQTEQPPQSPASSKPAPVTQLITPPPSPPSARSTSAGPVKDSHNKIHISPSPSTVAVPTIAAPTITARPTLRGKDKNLPIHSKAAALRSWLDDDNAKPKPRRSEPQRLSFENSGEKYDPCKPSQSNITTTKKNILPTVRPAKTVDVIRRMICHDLGIKVPKKTHEQRAKDMSMREQERVRTSMQREERKKFEEERIAKKMNGLW